LLHTAEAIFDKYIGPVFKIGLFTSAFKSTSENKDLEHSGLRILRFNIAYEWRYSTKKVFTSGQNPARDG
jgi:hypothetical protein